MLQTLKVHFGNIARKFHDTFYSLVFHARRKKGGQKKKQHSKLKVEELTCDRHGTCVRPQRRSPEEVKC